MSTAKIRRALESLHAYSIGPDSALGGLCRDALAEVVAIERACKEAYRNDVNHDLRKTDRGVDLGLLIELIAKDAP